MWLHKFIPQPCFDNASAEGGTAGGRGGINRTSTGARSTGIGMQSGGGYIETAQGIPGYGTPQEGRAMNEAAAAASRSGGSSGGGGSTSSVTRKSIPAPVPVAVKKPTISAPTLAQLTALTPKSYTAPVTSMNAATYGPNAMMSTPITASTAALASTIANAPTVSRAKSSPNMGPSVSQGPMSSPNTVSGSGYGSLANRAAMQGNIDAPSNMGVRAASGVGLDRPTVSNAGGKADREGPSFSGGPQSNAGNAVLGQSRSNVMSGQQDPSTNATGYSAAPGLLSRVGAANTAQNNSVLGRAVNAMGNLTGMSPVGLLANQAQIARDQFRTENPMATNPVAETTVNTGTLEPAEISTPVSEATLEAAKRMRDEQQQKLADLVAAGASRNMAAEPTTTRAPTMSPPGLTSPSTRTDIAGALNTMQQAQAAQQRMANAQASTNAIRQGLLNQQAQATPAPATAPTNQEMPGGVRDNLKDFSVVQGLLDNIRQGALGGSPTQQQPEQDADAARMERAILAFRNDQQGGQDTTDTTAERVASINPQDQTTSGGTTTSPGINKASGLNRAGTRTMQTVNGLVVHHTGGRGDVNSVIKTLNSRGLGVQFVVDRNGQIHQLTNEPNSIAYHTLQSSRNPTWNGPDISNGTAVGVEVIAKNDADVTQAQIEATARLGQWLSSQPFASENFAVVGHGAYQGGPGAAGRYGRSGKQADEGKRASEYYNSLSDEKKSQLNALMSGQIGGDIEDVDTGLVEGFLNAALSDEEAQAFLDQQGYSQTDEGKWTDGAKSFDTPMEAVKNLPLMSQLTLLAWWNNGSTPPPSRDGTNRGGGEWRPPGLLSASMGGPVTQPGNGNAGGGGPFVNGAGNWTPPGLLSRPYSNPWATRNPWLNV